MNANASYTKKLFVFDCDGTLIKNEVIDMLAAEAGKEKEVSEVTEKAMRGELDFEESLRERVAHLKGLDTGVFKRVYERLTVNPGAKELIEKAQSLGGRAVIVSGGFHEVLDPLAKFLGADDWKANRLEVVDGKLTGKLVGKIIDAETKAVSLNAWAEKYEIEVANSVAVGDGANDVPMMKEAGVSVAFNGKPYAIENATHSVTDDLRKIIELVY